MIEINNLSVTYRNTSGTIMALDNINLNIYPRDIVAVVGPSGCGKSTLLHVMAGILKNYEGNILSNGQLINPATQRIGFIPQNHGLLPWKNAYANALLGVQIKDVPVEKEYIDYILNKLGLTEFKNQFPSHLSGGQKQRVAIARSFLLRPDILLMDEPFSSLDSVTREECQNLFLDLWKENEVSTVFVTHSIDEAVYTGRRIAIMSPSPGRILHIFDNPLFGIDQLKMKKAFNELCTELRNQVKYLWST